MTQQDYMEYRYSYIYLMPIPHITTNGKTTSVSYTYVPTRCYSWTSNANRSGLTGEQRRVHYVYQACKIVTDGKGKKYIKFSQYVDNLSELSDDFIYIKEKFSKTVEAERGYDLDYEDGQEEDQIEAEKPKQKIK